jgi:hypothetical protein
MRIEDLVAADQGTIAAVHYQPLTHTGIVPGQRIENT